MINWLAGVFILVITITGLYTAIKNLKNKNR